MFAHLVRICALTALILACTFLPYLPGGYDGLAVTLSAMSQLFGAAGLLLVPLGVIWLIHETRKRARNARKQPNKDKGHYFAMASIGLASFVALIVSLGAFVNTGISLGIIVLALWGYCVLRMRQSLRFLKNAGSENFNHAPLYLCFVPTVAALCQFLLVGPATEYSRNLAISNSAALIHDIEEYHKVNGRYPASLLSIWPDYKPSVIGISRFHYEPSGGAYNIFFEQFSTQLGTREFVMYNKLDEHVMTSHAMTILLSTPRQLAARRGYYAVHNASTPHWKYFWFD